MNLVGASVLLVFLQGEPGADVVDLAARLWRAGTGLSLGDHLCLATAERLDATGWTAATAWGTSGRVGRSAGQALSPRGR